MRIDSLEQSARTNKALTKLALRPHAQQLKSGVVVKVVDGRYFKVVCTNLLDLMSLVRKLGGDLRG